MPPHMLRQPAAARPSELSFALIFFFQLSRRCLLIYADASHSRPH
jgi:hypothetical protein